VVVGVIDSGVDWHHEDLAANLFTNPGEIPDNGVDDDENGFVDDVRGWDFVNNDNDPFDDNGHGTHVAGIIAAAGNNGIGVTGVAWSARILPVKFLDANATGNVVDAVRAIEYARQMGVRLTNNSWGGISQSLAMRAAIAAAGARGVLFVASAGNDGRDSDVFPVYPAAYDHDAVVSVAGTDRNDERSGFSNYGVVSVDLGAPGSVVVSTLPGDAYGLNSGTSMAAAYVSGAACLLWGRAPLLTASEVKRALLAAVDPLPALAGRAASGGRLNVGRLLSGLDDVAPARVGNLTVEGASSSAVRLTWSAPGDDGVDGTARAYDLRYAKTPIDEGTFEAAARAGGMPPPHLSGSWESFEVAGLDFYATYHFALVVEDEFGNRSTMSNVVSATTLGVPQIDYAPESFFASLPTGGTSAQALAILNAGSGTLDFAVQAQPPWLRLDPPSGRAAGGGSATVTLTFDAAGLAGGFYAASVVFSTNDPARPGVSFSASMQVSGAPDVTTSAPVLDFGARSGPCTIETLVVTNAGTATLNASGVSVGESPFFADASAFLLGPGESRAVAVGFCPSSPGRSDATLTVHSNDPDEPAYAVTLKGRSVDPSAASVVPASLSASVYSSGVAERTLEISNDGSSTLEFDVAILEATPVVEAIDAVPREADVRAVGRPLSRDELGRLRTAAPRRIVVAAPDRTARGTTSARASPRAAGPDRAAGARLAEIFGSLDNEFVGDARVRGNFFACTKSTNLREHRFYLDPKSSGELWFLVYEGVEQTGVYFLVGASDVTPSGTGPGWYSSGEIQVPLRAGGFYLIVSTFEPSSSYFMEDSITPFPVAASFGELIGGAGWTWSPSAGFPPSFYQIVPPQAFNEPVAYHQTLVTDGVVTWSSVDRGAGTVRRGETTTLAVRFDATGLAEGDHDAILRVATSDPQTPEITVPMTLHVTGAADLSTSQQSLDLGECFVGASAKDTLVVSNTGTRTLRVTGITSSHDAYAVDWPVFTLVPNANLNVVVTFAPASAGAHAGVLTITCDDPDEPAVAVALRGSGVEPPRMLVSPPSVAEAVAPGGTVTRVLSITNAGPRDLSFFIEASADGAVEPGGKPGPTRKPQQAGARGRAPREPPAGAPSYTNHAARRASAPAGPPRSASAPGGLSVLLLHASYVSEIRNELLSFPDIALVDEINASLTIPPLDALTGYDAVVLVTDLPYADAVAMGDLLADYVDQGGAVVMTLASFIAGFDVRGRFLSGGYQPLSPGLGPGGQAELGARRSNHPVMTGVTAAFGELIGETVLEPGARWVADWNNGFPFVATRGGRVAAINAYLGDGGYWSGDVALVLHNALAWLAGAGWVAADPRDGVVPARNRLDVVLRFDAAALARGTYSARIRVAGNDPRSSEVVIPVSLTVDSTQVSAVDDGGAPARYALLPNRPNPFHPATTIAYELPRVAKVRLVVYDVSGKRVRELVGGTRPAGRHRVTWDGRDDDRRPVASGVYFYRITADAFVQTRKMVLLR
jgi:hypothetical protein